MLFLSVRRSSSQALPVLRRFLLEVHPDLLASHPRQRAINGENVALLQAYLRENTYVGSAKLLFFRKPEEDGSSLREARVIVGRGVEVRVIARRRLLLLGGHCLPRRRKAMPFAILRQCTINMSRVDSRMLAFEL